MLHPRNAAALQKGHTDQLSIATRHRAERFLLTTLMHPSVDDRVVGDVDPNEEQIALGDRAQERRDVLFVVGVQRCNCYAGTVPQAMDGRGHLRCEGFARPLTAPLTDKDVLMPTSPWMGKSRLTDKNKESGR
jgi:hypothetical protein